LKNHNWVIESTQVSLDREAAIKAKRAKQAERERREQEKREAAYASLGSTAPKVGKGRKFVEEAPRRTKGPKLPTPAYLKDRDDRNGSASFGPKFVNLPFADLHL
jgi:sRNA-binding protein